MPQAEPHSSDLPASCTPPSPTRPPARNPRVLLTFFYSSICMSSEAKFRWFYGRCVSYILPHLMSPLHGPGPGSRVISDFLTWPPHWPLYLYPRPLETVLPPVSRCIFPNVNLVASCHATAPPWFPVSATLMPTPVMPLCTSQVPNRGLARPEHVSVGWKKGRGLFQALTPDSGYESQFLRLFAV